MGLDSGFVPQLVDHVLLAVIEGFSEFLPVSSTGHMIIYDELLARTHGSGRVTYMIVIQMGAIAAIAHLYFLRLATWTRDLMLLWPTRSPSESTVPGSQLFLLKLALAVVPFGIVGLLFQDKVKALFNARSVGLALIAGGLLLILDHVRVRRTREFRSERLESLSWMDAVVVGCCQCLALWPGFSRSAAAILGARLRGFGPRTAAEVSFLIGLPTIGGTAVYEVLRSLGDLDLSDAGWLLLGTVIAWATALASVKWFLSIVSRGGLLGFGIYRCALGLFLLIYLGN